MLPLERQTGKQPQENKCLRPRITNKTGNVRTTLTLRRVGTPKVAEEI